MTHFIKNAPKSTKANQKHASRVHGPHAAQTARGRLIVFTRYPTPGKTKTRLIPLLGAGGAAELHRKMTQHTLCWARECAHTQQVSLEVHFQGGSIRRMRQCFGAQYRYVAQRGGDLGQRMAGAFHRAFQANEGPVVVVGTDCPALSANVIAQTLHRLRQNDVVLGPAADGGYYLIGLRREIPQLFTEIPWGSSHVFQETFDRATEQNRSVGLLETLADVDRPEDLDVWIDARDEFIDRSPLARISIIIPTLDEGNLLGDVLRRAARGRNVETIVADAGGGESTRRIAAAHGVRRLEVARGRAEQMNAAATVATGHILLFLHADTQLPDDFDRHVRDVLDRPGVAGGAFRLRIDGAGRSLRLVQHMANLRAKVLQIPYGDQAIFLRRHTFDRLGGFSDLPILEDLDLVRRLHREGRVEIAPAEVVTSARRWDALGTWRTTRINQMVLGGYYLGLSPHRLARWYHAQGHPR